MVDGTFLTGKYKGTLIMALSVDPKQQLVPLAFALAESENIESWSCFMHLVCTKVLGASQQVCMISDRHTGLLNCANDEIRGYPPLVHRWCMRHFAANMWRRQKKKEVIGKLKVLCSVYTELAFEEKLADLKKDLNDDAKAWLEGEMADKEKWAQAFDVGGKRYGLMTTNYSESLNNVLKGIPSRPVAGIIEYSFSKCNEYFVNRWNEAKGKMDKSERKGQVAFNYITDAEKRSINQLPEAFGLDRMIYSVRGAGGTNVGGDSHGGRHYKVDLNEGSCSCNVPQLLHLPCSHLITACKARGLSYEEMFMDHLYWRQHTLAVWEGRFEPYLDPSQWPEYNGAEYVPDPETKKDKKGARQKKRLKGDMDASQPRYAADYSFGDFDADKGKNRCSKCHKFIKDCKCQTKKKRKKRARVVTEVV
jgi:hypothetical protein